MKPNFTHDNVRTVRPAAVPAHNVLFPALDRIYVFASHVDFLLAAEIIMVRITYPYTITYGRWEGKCRVTCGERLSLFGC